MIPHILLISLTLLNLLSPLSVLAQTTSQVPASCQKIGVNSAAFFAQGDSFYQKAKSFGMGWTIEIARADAEGTTVDGINRAIANGLKPIIRIGLGDSSFGFINPSNYVNFLNSVAARANGPFYAVAGPNEPEYEHWLAQEKGQDYNVGDERSPNVAGINQLGGLLANYMNAVINGGVDSKVSLLSPSLSVTAWSTVPIIRAMKSAGANFSALAGFSGTSYSGNLGAQDIRIQIDKVRAELPGLSIVFTEFQDGPANLTALKADVDLVKSDPTVIGALLFNAFNTNTGWSQFALTDAQLAQVLGPECAVAVTPTATPVVTQTVRPKPRPTMRPCPTEDNPEFHPLRPYPGEPCDPLIPRSILPANDPLHIPVGKDTFLKQLQKDYEMRNRVAFSCGNSLDPNTPERFDEASLKPFDPGNRGICSERNGHVTCYLRENFALTLDLTDAQIPILGNTQIRGLTDAQRMTEYLSWYLNGTVQQSEQEPNPSIYRLVNFSGPLQKLLAFDLKNAVRSWLVEGPAGIPFQPPNSGGQYHNYLVEDPTRLKDLAGQVWSQLFRDIPFSSLEDTTGEVVISVSPNVSANQQNIDVVNAQGRAKSIPSAIGRPDATLKLIIKAKP